jgi:hypothetical protein
MSRLPHTEGTAGKYLRCPRLPLTQWRGVDLRKIGFFALVFHTPIISR